MILYENTTAKVRPTDGDTDFFEILACVLQGDTIAPYLFIICLDYVLLTSIDPLNSCGRILSERKSRRYPAKFITDADYADDLALLSSTIKEASFLLYALEKAVSEVV